MKNFDQFQLDENMQFAQYRRSDDVTAFSGADLNLKVETIDNNICNYLEQFTDFNCFVSAQRQDDLFSNAVLLHGHLTKGWHILHAAPKNNECNWRQLDVPEKVHNDIIQIFLLNEKKGERRCELIEPTQVFCTSGTTSKSKLVPVSRSRLLSNITASKELYFGCKKMLSVMPLGHVNSICGALTYCLFHNVAFVHSDFTSVIYINKLMATECPEILNCSPFYLETIVKLNEKLKVFDCLPSRIVCASAPLDEDTVRKIESDGSLVQPAYGLSEAVNFSLGFGCNDQYSAHEILKKFDFLPTGRPLAGNVVKIFDDANNEQPEKIVGNVAISGDIVFDGYLTNDAPSIFFNSSDGSTFLRTGDTGYIRFIDGYPYVKIIGRTKETFNFRGTQYYFTDLERLMSPIISEDFYVTDSSVYDRGAKRDECLCIAILKSGAIANSGNQEQGLKKRLSKILGNMPFVLWSITSFPRTKSGKIQRLTSVSNGKKVFE